MRKKKRSGLRLVAFILLGMIGLLLIVAIVLGLWLAIRPPLPAILKNTQVELVALRQEPSNGREFHHVTLHGREVGDIGVVVSLPRPMPNDSSLPLVVLLGGLLTAEDNLRYMPDVGQNIVLAYDWPIPAYFPEYPWGVARQTPIIYRQQNQIPGQIAAATQWTQANYPVDNNRISLVGLSLGALFTPAIQRVTQHKGIPVRWTVLAYGGAPISAIIQTQTDLGPEFPDTVTGFFAHLLTRTVSPEQHLPYLQGQFLVIHGTNDEYVPLEAAYKMQDLTPQPKTIFVVEGGHVGPEEDQLHLLELVADITTLWLLNAGAINPTPALQ
jgi:hypothetical protein